MSKPNQVPKPTTPPGEKKTATKKESIASTATGRKAATRKEDTASATTGRKATTKREGTTPTATEKKAPASKASARGVSAKGRDWFGLRDDVGMAWYTPYSKSLQFEPTPVFYPVSGLAPLYVNVEPGQKLRLRTWPILGDVGPYRLLEYGQPLRVLGISKDRHLYWVCLLDDSTTAGYVEADKEHVRWDDESSREVERLAAREARRDELYHRVLRAIELDERFNQELERTWMLWQEELTYGDGAPRTLSSDGAQQFIASLKSETLRLPQPLLEQARQALVQGDVEEGKEQIEYAKMAWYERRELIRLALGVPEGDEFEAEIGNEFPGEKFRGATAESKDPQVLWRDENYAMHIGPHIFAEAYGSVEALEDRPILPSADPLATQIGTISKGSQAVVAGRAGVSKGINSAGKPTYGTYWVIKHPPGSQQMAYLYDEPIRGRDEYKYFKFIPELKLHGLTDELATYQEEQASDNATKLMGSTQALKDAFQKWEELLKADQPNARIIINSGYRSQAYQDHLRSMREIYIYYKNHPNEPLTDDMKAVFRHLMEKHGMIHVNGDGVPIPGDDGVIMNPVAVFSDHTAGQAVDVKPSKGTTGGYPVLDVYAEKAGLYRPIPGTDKVHYILKKMSGDGVVITDVLAAAGISSGKPQLLMRQKKLDDACIVFERRMERVEKLKNPFRRYADKVIDASMEFVSGGTDVSNSYEAHEQVKEQLSVVDQLIRKRNFKGANELLRKLEGLARTREDLAAPYFAKWETDELPKLSASEVKLKPGEIIKKANLPLVKLNYDFTDITKYSQQVQSALKNVWPPGSMLQGVMKTIRERESDHAGGPNAAYKRPEIKGAKPPDDSVAIGRYQVQPVFHKGKIKEVLGWETSDWFNENVVDDEQRFLMAEMQDIVWLTVVMKEQQRYIPNLQSTRLGQLLTPNEFLMIMGYGQGNVEKFLNDGLEHTKNDPMIATVMKYGIAKGRPRERPFEKMEFWIEWKKLTGFQYGIVDIVENSVLIPSAPKVPSRYFDPVRKKEEEERKEQEKKGKEASAKENKTLAAKDKNVKSGAKK